MASSCNVCNCSRNMNMIQLSAISKLFLCSMLLLLRLPLAELTEWYKMCDEEKPIMNGSALEGNLKVLLNSLLENVTKTGYSISWQGENGDRVYGRAMCKGDLNSSSCRACVSDATNTLTGYCRNISGSFNEGSCLLRYATHNFYSEMNLSDASSKAKLYCQVGDGRSLDWNLSSLNLSSLLNRLMERVESSDVRYSTLSDYGAYSLAQCLTDLSVNHCTQCLNAMYTSLGSCPSGTIFAGAGCDYCMLTYSMEKFYSDGVPLLYAVPLADQEQQKDKGHPKMLGLSIGGAVIMVLLVAVLVVWKRKVIMPGFKKQLTAIYSSPTIFISEEQLDTSDDEGFWCAICQDRIPIGFPTKELPCYYDPRSQLSTAISKSKLNYKFQTLQAATKNFNPTNKIGQGGFGSIYKGVMPDGREIAVKRLFSNREESVDDFFNEVNLISCVQHKNIVKLLGCSVDGPKKLLVYEYLLNKSLDHFLFDKNMGNVLDWHKRFEIILGIASGLAYLHQESDIRIIHRDIKASNILLDHHFKPKIADFGLIRYFAEDQSHLSTRIVGTRGYMAPEYLVHGHLTEKVDVYAFGVLVLEIISGRRNITLINTNDITPLLTKVWNCHLSGTISSIIDPNIQKMYQEEVLQVVHIALLCTQTSATLRPSMPKVIMFLTNKNSNLLEPSQPPFLDAINLQSNIRTSVASIHSQSNTSDALNHSNSNTNTSISPTSKIHNPISKIASTPTTPMSLNTISTSSFGPR